MRLGYRLVYTSVRWFFTLFWRRRALGLEQLPPPPFLICANHRSWFDPPLISTTMPMEVGFLAKAELFRNPVFGRLIHYLNARPIQRGMVDRTAQQHVGDLLKRGLPVLVFPEGTRSLTGQMQPPRPGVGQLARQALVPIAPIYVKGTFHIWRSLLRWRGVVLRVGDPIPVEDIAGFPDTKDGYRALSQIIVRRICALSDDPARDLADAGFEPTADRRVV